MQTVSVSVLSFRRLSGSLVAVACAGLVGLGVLSACGGDDDGNKSETRTTGCKVPGSACSANDECCQKCTCTGDKFPVNFGGCSLASGAKTCQTCADFCGSKGVASSGTCNGC